MDNLITVQQAAQILGVVDSRVRQLILAGSLPSIRRFGRTLLDRDTVANFVRPPRGRPYGKPNAIVNNDLERPKKSQKKREKRR